MRTFAGHTPYSLYKFSWLAKKGIMNKRDSGAARRTHVSFDMQPTHMRVHTHASCAPASAHTASGNLLYSLHTLLLMHAQLTLFEFISAPIGILIGEATMDTQDVHAIVWDAWRKILFIGPGAYDDRGLDGALLIEPEDLVCSM